MSSDQNDATIDALILALDGSRASESAVRYVAALAAAQAIPVTVIHVFTDTKTLTRLAEAEVEWSESAEPRARIRTPAFLRESMTELETAGIDLTLIGRYGDVASQIIAEADRFSRPWIVMASLGATGIRRLLLGSNTLQTVRNSRFPVLVIPPGHRPDHVFRRGQARIALLVDGTPMSEAAIPAACTAATVLGGEINVIRVAETFRDQIDDEPAFVERDPAQGMLESTIADYVEQICSKCATSGVVANPVTLSGTPFVQISSYVEQYSPSLVILATQRQSGVERWTYGSFAEQLVGTLPTPTLLVPVDIEAISGGTVLGGD